MESAQDLAAWFAQNVVILPLIAGLLVIAYAYSGPAVDKVVRRAVSAAAPLPAVPLAAAQSKSRPTSAPSRTKTGMRSSGAATRCRPAPTGSPVQAPAQAAPAGR
jgi:hypothetical protein